MDKNDTVIRSGNVGALAVPRLAEQELYKVALIDGAESMPPEDALRLAAAPVEEHLARLTNTSAYDRSANAENIIITTDCRDIPAKRPAHGSANGVSRLKQTGRIVSRSRRQWVWRNWSYRDRNNVRAQSALPTVHDGFSDLLIHVQFG